MYRSNLGHIAAFIAVADEGSFTAAGRVLAISGSAVGQAIRQFEHDLGMQLFVRTTRSVALTEKGQLLLSDLRPVAHALSETLQNTKLSANRPVGKLRLLSPRSAVEQILLPALPEFSKKYPDIDVDITVADTDLQLPAAEYDAALKIGELISSEMVAVRLGPEKRQVVVGTPAFLKQHGQPEHPKDLVNFPCVRWRWSGQEHSYDWEFHDGGKWFSVHVKGPVLLTDRQLGLKLTLAGFGLCMVSSPDAQPYLDNGELVELFPSYCPSYPGWHICFPRQHYIPKPLRLMIDHLRRFHVGT